MPIICKTTTIVSSHPGFCVIGGALDMPPSRLFTTPPTDNLGYHTYPQKSRLFGLNWGQYLRSIENIVHLLSYRAINSTILGLKPRLYPQMITTIIVMISFGYPSRPVLLSARTRSQSPLITLLIFTTVSSQKILTGLNCRLIMTPVGGMQVSFASRCSKTHEGFS